MAVISEVDTLSSKNSTEGGIIYTDGSVIGNQQSAWAFAAQCGWKMIFEEWEVFTVTTCSRTTEWGAFTITTSSRTTEWGALSLTTSSRTTETMAETKAMKWLETQSATVSFLSDSVSMLKKVKARCIPAYPSVAAVFTPEKR